MRNGHASSGDWDGADGDVIYLEKTLRHEPTDMLLDETVTWAALRPVLRRSVGLTIKCFALFLLIWILTGGLASALGSRSSSSAFGSSSSPDDNPVLLIGIIISVLLFFVYWLIYLSSENQEAISEWCTLLVDKSAATESVYSHVAGRLRDRRLPIDNYVARRTPTRFGTAENRLVLVDGHYHVYVSVFSYGNSLYLGWTMWRIRTGGALVRQCFTGSSQAKDPIGRILRLERLKAMREAVHSVCREALHTAVRDVSVPESYGFPSGLPPIESLPYPSAPTPTGAGPSAPRPPVQR